MEKEVKCPWCEETVVPEVRLGQRKSALVRERKCPKCNNILAAYSEEEGEFLKKIRIF